MKNRILLLKNIETRDYFYYICRNIYHFWNVINIKKHHNENKTIILDKNLPTGKYTLKYENEDGTETIIDTVTM